MFFFTEKPYYFLIIDTTLIIDEKIRDKKLQYYVNREATKILALSAGKIYKYEDLTYEEMLPSDQSRIIEQAKFKTS